MSHSDDIPVKTIVGGLIVAAVAAYATFSAWRYFRGGNAPPPPLPPLPAAPGPARAPRKKPDKNVYLSKAFGDKISPDMFVPEDVDPKRLATACIRCNAVLSAASSHSLSTQMSDWLVDEIKKAGGSPRLTGDIDATLLLDLPDRAMAKLNEMLAERHNSETGPFVPGVIPSLEKIARAEMNFQSNPPGPPNPDRDLARPTDIGSAKLDITRPKEVSMKADAVLRSNEQLKAAKSFVQFEILGEPDKDGFVRVKPVFSKRDAAPSEKGEDHTKIQAINIQRQTAEEGSGDDGDFVSWADCHRTAQLIMGSEDQPGGVADTEKLIIGHGEDKKAMTPLGRGGVQYLVNGKDSGASRALYGMLGGCVPDFLTGLLDGKEEGDMSPAERKAVLELDLAVRVQAVRTAFTLAFSRKARAVEARQNLDKSVSEEAVAILADRLNLELQPPFNVYDAVFDGNKLCSADDLARVEAALATYCGVLDDLEEKTGLKFAQPDALDPPVPTDLRATYHAICADPKLLDAFSRELGINEYAAPVVGDAMCQLNDDFKKKQAEDEAVALADVARAARARALDLRRAAILAAASDDGGDEEKAAADAAEKIAEEAEEAASNAKDLWNYHWAGVVMVNPDGSFMTLENLSVEDAAAVNEDWYFALYQADGEGSFHAINCLDDHVVDGATTIVMKNTEKA